MTTVEESVEIEVPVRAAYDQWTQFAEFPRFMDGVERVDQLDATHTHWVTKIDGVQREFDAEITEQIPDERIAWRSRTGPQQGGVVTFHRLEDNRTKIMLQLEHDPSGFAETVGDKLGFVRRLARRDLDRFREFMELRDGRTTGGWRGEV
ncbi:SRPBCC family protein [Yinghuangia seranimata]|uniref:SRPBCC family protein n=1 Tax=Yinghuangia seranimata TaxID=408067 RepID=UPI00248BD273|nr:SRPBCC family protein [Yinghuangia seranimata]MDI2125398.1 SRPBCC family protein [Yinghuangia seranimata]